jgi:PAS domain S-box-containing protein
MTDQVRVLHVDDDADFASLTAAYLGTVDDGLEVVTASSAADGLDHLAATDRFDCVVSDYDMPETNGLEFLDAVRDSHPNLPFIFFTGKGSEEIASEAIARGATDYLQKGGGRDRYELLANRIRNAVDQYRSEAQAAELQRIRTVVRDVNRALIRATSRDDIEASVCDILSTTDPYDAAVIGEVVPQTQEIHPRTVRGVDESYFADWEMSVAPDSPGRHAPGGRAFHSHEIAVSQDMESDPTYEPWHEPATERGLHSLAVVPLVHDDHVYGLLALMSSRPHAFDEVERTLLTELGDDIAHAIHRQHLSIHEQAVNDAPIGISIADATRPDVPLIYVNDEFVQLTGYSREETLGRNCRFLQGPGTRDEPVRKMREAIADETTVTVELRNYRKDRTMFWNRVSLSPLRDDDGEVTHYVGFQENVTARRSTGDEARDEDE